MNTSELKEKIAESKQVDFYNNKIKVVLNYPAVSYNRTIEGASAIFEFLEQQIEGFSSFGQKLPEELKQVTNIFTNVKNSIESLVKSSTTAYWEWEQRIKNQLESPHPPKFTYESPSTEFLIKLYNEHRDYYIGAYEYLAQGSLNNVSNKNQFTGFLLAYEFTHKDSKITEKKEAEKRSLAKLRNDFGKYLNESESHLVTYIENANKKVIDSSKNIDDFLKNKKDSYDDWFGQTSKGFITFFNASNEKIRELEDLYQKKLQLEAPAKYWRLRAKKLNTQGMFWLSCLIASTAIALAVLLVILNDVSTATLEKVFQNTGTAIKWSVIVITVVSFLAYAIRTFAKLTFSSFHLARDAEEREQLTYVYLALQKLKAIDPTERHLIMQSLFSRADSGLLKDEGGPTMPGNILDKALAR